MTEQRIPTKAELLEALRSSGDELLAKVAAMPEAELAKGRYENGWTARQILAHVASIEWTYPRLIELARQAPATSGAARAAAEVRRTDPSSPGGPPTRTAQGGVDAYNQRQVEQRAGKTVAELLEEFKRNRAAMIAAVDATDDSLLATPIRSAGGITGPLGGVLRAVSVVHVRGHLQDILGQPRPPAAGP